MRKSLAAGSLNRNITIEQPTLIQAGDGTNTTTWTTVAQVFANIAPLSANAFIAAQTLQSKISCRVTIRYRRGLNTSMRLVDDHGTVYKPEGFLPDADTGREYLTIPCTVINSAT